MFGMLVKRWLFLLCLLPLFISTAAAESTLSLPCDPELSPFLATSEHEISKEIDLAEYYRMQIDNWEDDIPISGSLIILDMQFMIINLRFAKDFDYDAAYMHVPEKIMLVNYDTNISNDTGIPEWRVTIYPDEDDPYSFHYAGTWDLSMCCTRFYGSYVNQQGEDSECFSLHVDSF